MLEYTNMQQERTLKNVKQQLLGSNEYCAELQDNLKKMTQEKSDVESELRSLQITLNMRR